MKYRIFDLKKQKLIQLKIGKYLLIMNLLKTELYSDKNSEQDLWFAFRQGRNEAYACLYKKYYRQLYAYGIHTGLDNSQTADAIQELFLKLFEKPELITDAKTLSSFLFRSIRNYAINTIKKESKYTGINEDVLSFSFEYSIEEDLIAEEDKLILAGQIDEVFSCLTSRQKEIIYFRYLYEMDYEEIARIMQISPQSARNMIYKAFEKIRKKYPQYLLHFVWIVKYFFPQ